MVTRGLKGGRWIATFAACVLLGCAPTSEGTDDAGDFSEVACWRYGAVANPFCDQGWAVLSVQRMWANPGYPTGDARLRHNAFTSLVLFGGNWYCGFRSAADHGPGAHGHVRILRSKDGRDWEQVALMPPIMAGADLRDPKLFVTAEGTLAATTSEVYNHGAAKERFVDGQGTKRRQVGWVSKDGASWSDAYYCTNAVNTWIWGITTTDDVAFGIAYCGARRDGALYRTTNGLDWTLHEGALFPAPSALEAEHGNETGNEGALAFAPDGAAYLYLRGGPRSGGAHVGTSRPPHTEWQWKSRISPNIGGPCLVRLADGRYVIGGRQGWGVPHAKNSMVLWLFDPEKPAFTEILSLPSGGDCSYPGIVEYEGELWISYYSSHEDPNPEQRNLWGQRSNIYLARVRIGPPPAP